MLSKNSAVFRTGSRILTAPLSISRAMPSSSGSAIMVMRFFLLGVMAKHLVIDWSTTVSQNRVTGSDTLISMSEYSFRRSCSTQSM